jgi:hypothetical protein
VGRTVNERDEGPRRDPTGNGGVDPVLRDKYLDYCSAQIAEIFLSLSDERIYELVEEAAHESNLSPGTLGFDAMVKLVTKKLRDSVPLPDLDTWIDDYSANPEHYDHLLLGLWDEGLDEESEG